jgi:hypothetical protein
MLSVHSVTWRKNCLALGNATHASLIEFDMKETTSRFSPGQVCLVPHDPRWSELYQCAEADLPRCLGTWIVSAAQRSVH